MNDKCIFCLNPLDNSDEHIIPESVNGRLHSKNLICHNCNSRKFGAKIDTVLTDLFKPLYSILGLKGSKSLQLEDPDGKKYLMKTSGGISSVSPEMYLEKKDGLIYLSVTGNEKNAIKMFAKHAAPFYRTDKKPIKLQAYRIKEISPPLRLKFKITVSSRLILLLNKIALEFFAYNNLDLKLVSHLLDRTGKLDVTLNNVKFINFQQEVREFKSQEISHLISIRSHGAYLFCYIEIFNLICCVITLSEKYAGEDINRTYYQDAISGERINSEIDLNLNFEKINSKGDIPQPEDFVPLIDGLFERQNDRNFQKVLEETLDKIKDDLRNKISDGLLKEELFYEEYITLSTQAIAHLTFYDFPYTVEEFCDEKNDQVHYIHSNLREEVYDEFCKLNNHLKGIEISFPKEGLFLFDSFFKTPSRKIKEHSIIRVYCVLKHKETGQKKYIPYRNLFEGLRQKE